jgi:hypothetical protein
MKQRLLTHLEVFVKPLRRRGTDAEAVLKGIANPGEGESRIVAQGLPPGELRSRDGGSEL